ncbi:MlaD family protein [Stratiformator vulcanicus]|uniref:Mce related protein n=1 Tax=Stratiformator vulcanicus TaxID=2527980 RepID=A0A517QYQ1_9PLAN|nr:MlaD family protein [Stratiformator vulcanicus]QDT36670.1 mce related protein [Stratiformator vulcanicus]
MSERQLQFRVGIFTVFAIVAASAMVIAFGKVDSLFDESYQIAVHFEKAPGIFPGTPVRKNGISIGKVVDIRFDDEHGGVIIVADIQQHVKLRTDAKPLLQRTLIGDASINFEPGTSQEFVKPGQQLHGVPPIDPMEIVGRLETQFSDAVASLEQTSIEYRSLAKNVNGLINENRGQIEVIIAKAATSLDEFAVTMRGMQNAIDAANALVADEANQKAIKETLQILPTLVEDTRKTVNAAQRTISNIDENMINLKNVTGPLAERSERMTARVESILVSAEGFAAELDKFAHLVNDGDGSLHLLASDPKLYKNLNRSAESLSVLLSNLGPVLRDLRVFSDKIARHPELIGVRGALRGSDGLKSDTRPVPSPPERTSNGSSSRAGRSDFR